jgi:hypothetical protein
VITDARIERELTLEQILVIDTPVTHAGLRLLRDRAGVGGLPVWQAWHRPEDVNRAGC